MTLLNLKSNERVAIVGMTGSGKSYLARYMMQDISRLILCDPKGEMLPDEWDFEEYTDEKLDKLKNKKAKARLRILAPINGNWEPFFEKIYAVGDVTVYIDEAYGVTNLKRVPGNWLNALYTRGRTRGIGVWTATQRPAWIPIVMLSEAEWSFVFRLQYPDDRRRVSSIYGDRLMVIPPDEFGFWVKYYRWPLPVYSRGLKVIRQAAVSK